MTLVEATEIVPAGQSNLIALSAPITDIVKAQHAYHEVCAQLLDENDVQTIGSKAFKKRSAWNKLAVAFGVSTTEVRTVHERDERGRIIRTECVVRAEAPNGRRSDGIGACDLYERCCDPETCSKLEVWEDSGRPTGHTHCSYPCKQAHFSNPQHDIPATAFTRASNRAKADLFGMGEVSAEEITGDNTGWQPNDSADQPARQSQDASQTSGKAKSVENMKKRIFAVSKALGMSVSDAIESATGDRLTENDLDFDLCRKVNDWLTDEQKRQSA